MRPRALGVARGLGLHPKQGRCHPPCETRDSETRPLAVPKGNPASVAASLTDPTRADTLAGMAEVSGQPQPNSGQAPRTWHGNPRLERDLVPIEGITPDPANDLTHGDGDIEFTAKSLQRSGQQKRIVLNPEGTVTIAGAGALLAAKRLGWTHIAVDPTDLQDPDDQRAYAVADNQTGRLAEWDPANLHPHLVELQERLKLDPVKDFGFGAADPAILEGHRVTDPLGEWAGMPEFDNPDAKSFRRITVHLQNQTAVEEFARLLEVNVNAKTLYVHFPKGSCPHEVTVGLQYESDGP